MVRVRIDGVEHEVDIEYRALGASETTREPLTDLAGETHTPERWQAIRQITNEHGKKSRPGVAWVESSQQMVEFESRTELAALLFLEFEGGVWAITPQPFRLHFGKSRKPSHHVPDFFIRQADGTGVVVNVKPEHRLTSPTTVAQFKASERACEQAGWKHRVVTTLTPQVRSNVNLLAGYRRAPMLTDVVLPAAFDLLAAGPAPIVTVANRVAEAVDLPAPLVMPPLFHALWTHDITFAITQPLDTHTPIALPEETK